MAPPSFVLPLTDRTRQRLTVASVPINCSIRIEREKESMDSERTVATALAHYLCQAGVTRVFGYPGESVVDFMAAARDGGPAIIAAVREASAAFMA
ncbi:thiamine pyrophosphate-binding protein, partial [Trebonia sp.]|uniref:thiamine pyrophosphate-binding protein n=1 Tax=Trebonia sp. TaxID=2767075 RepID=UPI003C716D36